MSEQLTNFYDFSKSLDPYSKGLSIANFEFVKKVHNEFKKPIPMIIEGTGKKGDAYHFVAFVQKENRVYEVDGLQEGPILIDKRGNDRWTGAVLEEVSERIKSYA